MRAFVALSCALIIGLASALAGQAPAPTTPGQPTQPGQTQPSTRSPARAPRPGESAPMGSAVIRGQVLAADTGAPVRRAQVRIVSPESRSGGTTSTNNDGSFEVKNLAAGRYTVIVSKGGFVAMQFGQRRPNEPGTPIELGDGQTAERVNFALLRGGVIAGRIVDDLGEPVSGASVAAMRFQFLAGSRRLMPAASEGAQDRTDDQGGFRLYGLPPGEYYVSATSRSGNIAVGSNNINNTEAEGYAPTYYPGTMNIAEAQRIPVRAGQESPGGTFAMIVARMAKVSGRALNSRGEPVSNAMVMLAPAELSGLSFSFPMSNMLAADGAFAIPNVAPGRYNLQVRPLGMPGPTTEFGLMPLTVGADDISNLAVITSPGAVARGVIQTDDGTPPPFRADAVQLFANTAEPMTMSIGGQARINDDMTFEIPALFDRRLIRASVAAGTGWYLKGVYLNGDDVTDTGVTFEPGREVDGFEVVFTQKTTELSGLLTDNRGRPVVDASVVIFPANRDRWAFNSRFLRTVRPDTEGRYNARSLPPNDDYLIIAVKNLEQGQGGDPEFLGRAADEAKRFTLAEGETKAVDVKLSALVP